MHPKQKHIHIINTLGIHCSVHSSTEYNSVEFLIVPRKISCLIIPSIQFNCSCRSRLHVDDPCFHGRWEGESGRRNIKNKTKQNKKLNIQVYQQKSSSAWRKTNINADQSEKKNKTKQNKKTTQNKTKQNKTNKKKHVQHWQRHC